jgi:hypothetical protein
MAEGARSECSQRELTAMVGLLVYLQLGERPASLASMAAKPRGECSYQELAASMPTSEETRPATPPLPRLEGAR